MFNHSESILSYMETYYIKYRHILAAFAQSFVTLHQRSHMANARLQTSRKHNSTIYRHPFNIFSLIHHIKTSLQWSEEQKKSIAKKQQEASEEKAELQKVAVERYRAELEKPVNEGKVHEEFVKRLRLSIRYRRRDQFTSVI